MKAVFTATMCDKILTVTQHNNRTFIHASQQVSLFVWHDLHYTVHAQHLVLKVQFVLKNVRVRWRRNRNFSSFAALQGSGGGHIPGQFHCHHEDRGQSEVNTPHRAGNTLGLVLHPLTRRTRTFDWAAIWNLCTVYPTKANEKYTNNSTFPFLWPSIHIDCGDAKLPKLWTQIETGCNSNLLDGLNICCFSTLKGIPGLKK